MRVGHIIAKSSSTWPQNGLVYFAVDLCHISAAFGFLASFESPFGKKVGYVALVNLPGLVLTADVCKVIL